MTLHIFGGSDYLQRQETRLRQLAHWLRPAGTAALVVGVAGWLAFVVQSTLATERNAMALTLATLLALAAPFAVRRLLQEADQFAAGIAGEARLTAFLQAHLDAQWTLWRNVALPDARGDIDAVLLGPTGLYALEVKAYQDHYRNEGATWARRDADGNWQPVRVNPTQQAHKQAAALQAFLDARGAAMPVAARVAWAGDGVVLTEAPAVPVWQLHQTSDVLNDILGGERLADDALERVRLALVAVSAESTPQQQAAAPT